MYLQMVKDYIGEVWLILDGLTSLGNKKACTLQFYGSLLSKLEGARGRAMFLSFCRSALNTQKNYVCLRAVATLVVWLT